MLARRSQFRSIGGGLLLSILPSAAFANQAAQEEQVVTPSASNIVMKQGGNYNLGNDNAPKTVESEHFAHITSNFGLTFGRIIHGAPDLAIACKPKSFILHSIVGSIDYFRATSTVSSEDSYNFPTLNGMRIGAVGNFIQTTCSTSEEVHDNGNTRYRTQIHHGRQIIYGVEANYFLTSSNPSGNYAFGNESVELLSNNETKHSGSIALHIAAPYAPHGFGFKLARFAIATTGRGYLETVFGGENTFGSFIFDSDLDVKMHYLGETLFGFEGDAALKGLYRNNKHKIGVVFGAGVDIHPDERLDYIVNLNAGASYQYDKIFRITAAYNWVLFGSTDYSMFGNNGVNIRAAFGF